MAIFWTWGVRNPFAGLFVVAVAAGAGGIVAWGLALSTAAVSAIAADVAHHLGTHARAKSRRRRAALQALDEAPVISITAAENARRAA